ncbi:hypothetical protein OIDMADRAFT_56838 [Oidiodendron maius Zn]|uniref:Uncharacterized protein n=1 Tax=Oidiodendron maius (strain Zn) TaxID=913774 RepID=A0A0C3D973_OIDMZ|nr:hypothetical protein OIDMADRAFT_56838 [Oidiodendron maius Zn]
MNAAAATRKTVHFESIYNMNFTKKKFSCVKLVSAYSFTDDFEMKPAYFFPSAPNSQKRRIRTVASLTKKKRANGRLKAKKYQLHEVNGTLTHDLSYTWQVLP